MRARVHGVEVRTVAAEHPFQPSLNALEPCWRNVATGDRRLVGDDDREAPCAVNPPHGVGSAAEQLDLLRRFEMMHFAVERAVPVEKHRRTQRAPRQPFRDASRDVVLDLIQPFRSTDILDVFR
jgi:hypothetical protein